MLFKPDAEAFPGRAGWTNADSDAAEAEGWNLWECEPSVHGPFQLLHDEEASVFQYHQQAWLHVAKRAAQGSPLHLKALAFLREHNPAEAVEIRRQAALQPGG